MSLKDWSRRVFIKPDAVAHGRGNKLTPLEVIAAGVASFIGIGLVVVLFKAFPELELLVIGSFGASAVLIYGAPKAPFSQPRNLVLGHLLSAVIGLACFYYLPAVYGLQEAAAVSLSIMAMQMTRSIHPPGGATALIAVIGSEFLHNLGWGYVLLVMTGVFCMLLVAMVVNNLFQPGIYPQRWD